MRPSDLKSLKVLLGLIRAELASVREGIEAHSASISRQRVEQQRTSQEEWNKTQEVLSRPRRTDPNELAASEANRKRHHWQNFGLQGLLTLGTWLAFAAAGFYACEAHKQSDTMNRTYFQIQEQTALLQQQLEETHSASIYVDPFGLSTPGVVGFNFHNLGHYAATNISATAIFTLREFPTGRVIASFGPYSKTIPRIDPPSDWRVELLSNRNNFVEWPVYYRPSTAQAAMLEEGRAAIAASLSYSYNNGFLNVQKDAGCLAYFKRPPLWTKVLPSGQTTGSGNFEGGFPCDGLAKGMADAVEWEEQHKSVPGAK